MDVSGSFTGNPKETLLLIIFVFITNFSLYSILFVVCIYIQASYFSFINASYYAGSDHL